MIIDDIIEAVNDADFDIDFKGLFTVSKALFTTFGIYKATTIWNKSTSALAKPAIRLLGFNAVLVALITIYKLTRREIAPLFVLQCLSHYSCFLTFAALAGFGSHPRIKKGKRGDRRIALAIWSLHFLYAAVLVVGFMWAECNEGHVYPISFLLSDSLLLISYIMLLYVKKRGFDVSDLKKNDDGANDGTTDKEDLELFEAQVAAFFSQQRILVIWHFVEMILGYVLFNVFLEEAVICDENGDAWVFNFKGGKAFLLLHTYGVKQGLGVASKVFFKTVKKVNKKRAEAASAKAKGE
mmetsp:Transcript_19765/g.32707  ORF Transcript_19765/g.32707 Transcript_19765/m.32707 type:complete len:296 (-) Transcript_19765:201-1088(-)|eukprot:CAMPEP_0197727252 /NCGR_PEP_ID=MMETSP1434-20131217/18819_1 /TAXON_ID=265543 /ORGANISM="Minutocellus polymorphus, Strain CCMP3303" /LENGTH=295 /DNA_ID=CAMNT_0043313397 /DNA_START=160 /DNA_END=1047 /DNA_ORIENTATION=+